MPTNDFWSDLPDNRRKQPQAPPTDAVADQTNGTVSSPIATKKPVQLLEPVRPDRQVGPTLMTILRLLGILALIGIGGGTGLSLWAYQAFTAAADPNVITGRLIDIQPGTSTRTIARDLEEQGLISSQLPFLAALGISGKTLRAGTYTLTPNLTMREIIEIIASGNVSQFTVTIPEGWRLEQVAALLEKNSIVEAADFLAAAHYDPVRYVLPPGINLDNGASLEGLLFPDTYQFAYGVTNKEIVTTMLNNFTTRTADIRPTYEQLILASIVEREAKLAADRAPIAGVYANRLKSNLKLEADPTVQYGKDSLATASQPDPSNFDWWQPITLAEYQTVQSPYNTYLTNGLPPGPISLPGLRSIEAAAKPTEHDFYFFLHISSGETRFARTAEEHAANKLP